MKFLLLVNSIYAQASGSEGHTHGSGGENEHLYPIIGVFVVLIVLGFAAGHFLNKKK